MEGMEIYRVENSSGRFGYILINSLILFITFVWFVYDFHDIDKTLSTSSLLSVGILLGTVILVHTIKAFRLYFEIYGTGCTFDVSIKTYCKVTPVSIVLPFKVGELFRMYCYGRQLNSTLKGIIIILLDRFMDTLAVVTIMALIWLFNSGKLSVFVYVLLIFLVFIVLLYSVFPGVYNFWKKYFLKVKASEHKIQVLKLLEAFWVLYEEIAKIVKGRGIILYFLSLIAWMIEIGSVIITGNMSMSSEAGTKISAYLTSAMNGKGLPVLDQFVFFSVIGLVIFYLVLSISRLAVRKEDIR